MQVKVEIIDSTDTEEAIIKAYKKTDEIKQAIELLEMNTTSIIGYIEKDNYVLNTKDIYYIESVDNKSFIYVNDLVYEAKYKLYELEQLLPKSIFFRCSKQMICNVKKISHVKASVNGRFDCYLKNDEKIIISRSYVKDFKKLLGMWGCHEYNI